MKILIITGSFPPMRCGVGDYAHQLAITLARSPDFQIAVLTSQAAASCDRCSDFAFFPVVEKWSLSELRRIFRTILAWKPDVVHIQYPTQGYFGCGTLPAVLPLLLWTRGIPIVQTWHELFALDCPLRYWKLLPAMGQPFVPSGLIVVREDFRRRASRVRRFILSNRDVHFIPNASAVPSVALTELERKEVRSKYAKHAEQVIAFFGLLYEQKGVELLFQIADVKQAHLVIVGGSIHEADRTRHSADSSVPTTTQYENSLRLLAETDPWNGKVTMTGFLPTLEAARVLAAADAVVLPFLNGAGLWNTSLHAAQAQGTFTLTTSESRRDYDPEYNTYYAAVGDVDGMRAALAQYIGRRQHHCRDVASRQWYFIAEAHCKLYRERLSKHRPVSQAASGR